MPDKSRRIFICRCEEVSEAEILEAISNGCTTLDEVKRMTRAGMGPCQGRFCSEQIARILSKTLDKPRETFLPFNVRFPTSPIRLTCLTEETQIDKNTWVKKNGEPQ